jgi:hypothetical protein
MKYTTEVIINLPRTRVLELFDSTENLCKWQEGLKSFRVISGEPGEVGCRSELIYEGRKGDLEMIETITKRNLPEEFHCIYEARGVYNEMFNYFSETDEGHTAWQTVSVFKFRGLMALMTPFMKTAFTSNTLLNMERFKSFAEKIGVKPQSIRTE